MTTTTALCVEATCARHATHGLLCWADRDRLARLLDPTHRGGIDPERPELGHQPGGIAELYRVAVEGHGDLGEREHEHADAARVDDHAIAIRDARTVWAGAAAPRSVVATLGGWARVVHEERGDALPTIARRTWVTEPGRWGHVPAGVVVQERRPVPTTDPALLAPWTLVAVQLGRERDRPDVQAVEALCRWLWARLDWIAAQPWVDELAADVRDVAAQLRASGGHPGGRHLGPCPATVDPDTGALDPASGTVCGGPLYAPLSGAREPGPVQVPSVACERCGASYSGRELLALARDRGLVADGAADGCPVHDLPAERAVRVRVQGSLLEGPAEQVCATWHREHERAG